MDALWRIAIWAYGVLRLGMYVIAQKIVTDTIASDVLVVGSPVVRFIHRIMSTVSGIFGSLIGYTGIGLGGYVPAQQAA